MEIDVHMSERDENSEVDMAAFQRWVKSLKAVDVVVALRLSPQENFRVAFIAKEFQKRPEDLIRDIVEGALSQKFDFN